MNKILVKTSLLITSVTLIICSAFSQQINKTKPNIVILFADDLGWVDVSTGQTNGGRGTKVYSTPNINSIIFKKYLLTLTNHLSNRI